jgi:hypothetical protein
MVCRVGKAARLRASWPKKKKAREDPLLIADWQKVVEEKFALVRPVYWQIFQMLPVEQ